MWGIVVSALASSVVSFVVSNITQQPAVTINATTPTNTEKDELFFWKSALFLAIGYMAYSTLKKG